METTESLGGGAQAGHLSASSRDLNLTRRLPVRKQALGSFMLRALPPYLAPEASLGKAQEPDSLVRQPHLQVLAGETQALPLLGRWCSMGGDRRGLEPQGTPSPSVPPSHHGQTSHLGGISWDQACTGTGHRHRTAWNGAGWGRRSQRVVPGPCLPRSLGALCLK